jgi:hypothetical protein
MTETKILIEDLRKTVESQTFALKHRRTELQSQLDEIDAALAKAEGGSGRRKGKPRVKNPSSLRAVVLEVLKGDRKGLTLADLADKVSATGYKSNSKNFKNVLYQCVYNTPEIQHNDSNGCYRLVK